MVIGILCNKKGRIAFEDCEKCAECLPAIIIKGLRRYEHKKVRNSYSVGEIVRCLRKAYFDRKEPPENQYYTLKDLLSMRRGKLFEGLFRYANWKELDGSLEFEVDTEKVKLYGRIDAYDLDKQEIIELKSTVILDNTKLPRKKDELQLQCYGTIFKTILNVKKLTLVYFDMSYFEKYYVPFVDKGQWIEQRIQTLHRAIRDLKPSKTEQSFMCVKCMHKEKCSIVALSASSHSIPKMKKQTKWRV